MDKNIANRQVCSWQFEEGKPLTSYAVQQGLIHWGAKGARPSIAHTHMHIPLYVHTPSDTACKWVATQNYHYDVMLPEFVSLFSYNKSA